MGLWPGLSWAFVCLEKIKCRRRKSLEFSAGCLFFRDALHFWYFFLNAWHFYRELSPRELQAYHNLRKQEKKKNKTLENVVTSRKTPSDLRAWCPRSREFLRVPVCKSLHARDSQRRWGGGCRGKILESWRSHNISQSPH